jgi:hypothetical protein
MMTNSIVKNATLLCSIFAALLTFTACDPLGVRATGDDMTQTFDETGFDGLDLGLSANVTVLVDSVYRVEVTCEETAMPYVETRVTNGVLKIYFDRNVYDVDNMRITVSAPSWNYFDVSGSGKVKIADAIEGNVLHLDVSGSGNILAEDATFNKADVEVSGSGDVELAGSADELRAKVSGSGEVDALDFPVKSAYLKVSGSGNIRSSVLDFLDVDISGSGNVYYEGNPQLDVHISGSGDLRKL